MLTGNTLKSGNFSVIWDYSRKGFYKTTSDCKQVNIVVSFRTEDRLILTVARFAGAATVCKARIFSSKLKPLKISSVSSRNKVAGIFAGIRYGRGLFQGKRGLTIEIFLYLRPNREVQRSNNSYSEYQSCVHRVSTNWRKKVWLASDATLVRFLRHRVYCGPKHPNTDKR